MEIKEPYNTGVEEVFSNFSKDPCLGKHCVIECPVGFTCIRAVPPRSGEFRLDLSLCNLKCPFCWTINKPHPWYYGEIFEHVKCRFDKFCRSNLNVSIGYLRITGGEPILTEGRARHLLSLFQLIDDDLKREDFYAIWKTRKSPENLEGRKNIKIQTNGITISKIVDLFVDKLISFKNISLTFEVSLKGTNPYEFQILSGGFPSERFFEQIKAIDRLLDCEDQGFPVFVRGILGIFHSAQYDLVFEENGKRMMLDPCREFKKIVSRLQSMPRCRERVYVEPLRFTAQMKEAEETCRNLRIVADSRVGRYIKPGKKIRLKDTYLEKMLS
ncbi:MAG: hypothetical protein ABSD73_02730 [Candidatus Bathyarchaeia archaeon]